MMLPLAIMALVTLQRSAELLISARNTRYLRAVGAFEVGAAHYPAMVLLHGSWLAALWLATPGRTVHLPLLALFALLQALRVWVLWTLGRRWTTRVIVLPGAPMVRSGPFRFLRHPNYCVVTAEIAVLPLVFGLVWIALVFTLLNGAMLWVRIRAETQALYG
ncbi:MAG: isoprenylcysteine carboxylmethyltransferase family protein [Pseudomonadota bacterium]